MFITTLLEWKSKRKITKEEMEQYWRDEQIDILFRRNANLVAWEDNTSLLQFIKKARSNTAPLPEAKKMLKNVQAVSFTYQAAVADTEETVEERNNAKKLEESIGMFCPKVEVR